MTNLDVLELLERIERVAHDLARTHEHLEELAAQARRLAEESHV